MCVSPSVLSLVWWLEPSSLDSTLHRRQRLHELDHLDSKTSTFGLHLRVLFMCITRKGRGIKLANEHWVETSHLKSVSRVFQLTDNPFFKFISSPCQERFSSARVLFTASAGHFPRAAESAATKSSPETFIKLETHTAENQGLHLSP